MDLDPGERLRMLEERRKAAEGVLWQLPGLSLAAQSFLLASGLAHDASDWTRRITGALGLFVVGATAAVLAFQGTRMSVMGRWIELEVGNALDEATLKEALEASNRGRKLNRAQRFLFALPTPFWAWALLLAALAFVDALVLASGLG